MSDDTSYFLRSLYSYKALYGKYNFKPPSSNLQPLI